MGDSEATENVLLTETTHPREARLGTYEGAVKYMEDHYILQLFQVRGDYKDDDDVKYLFTIFLTL